MRIVLCTQQFGNYWSGLGSYATLLAKGLKNRGIDLTIITPGDTVEGLDAQYISVEPSSMDPTHGGWFSLAKRYGQALEGLKADLVHFTDARESYFYRGSIPAIGTLHDDYFARHRWNPFHYRSNYVDWVKRYAYYSFVNLTERKALRNLAGLIANSACTGETISNRYGVDSSMVKTIYIQPDLTAVPIDSDLEVERLEKKQLLFVGGNIQRKGLPLVLHALQQLKSEHPELKLTILGKNQNLGKMQQLAKKLGVRDHVDLKGWVAPGQISAFYQDSTLFVMPSLMEGYGLVYLEAMAHGLPVIAANVGGTQELVRHLENGLMVNPAEVGELVEGIRRLLTDVDLRRSLISGGYQTVEQLNIDQMVGETLSYYQSFQALSGAQ